MRKALALFVAVCMFLSLCTGVLTPLSTARADVGSATLSLTPTTGITKWVNGETFDLTLRIDISGASVNALDTTITYDPNVLQVVSAQPATDDPSTLSIPIELDWTRTSGSVYVANGQPSGTDGTFATSGNVAVIHFRTLATPADPTTVGFADGTRVLEPNPDPLQLGNPINVFTGATGAAVTVLAHHINVTAGANGTVTPFGVKNNGDVTEADKATPTFTFTPATGYQVATVMVNGTPVTPANSYTFAPVTMDQTLAVTFCMNQATALDAVNNASSANNYAAVTAALVDNAGVLGLNLTDYNTLIAARQPSVANDIYCSKPATDGYTLAGLQTAFNAIVATRHVCQDSLDLVNKAAAGKPLADLTYVQMLLTEFNKVKSAGSYTYHSGMTIQQKIDQLTGLVNRYAALPAAGRTAALLAVSSGTPYASSTLSLDALSNALAAQESAVSAALTAVNGASPANNYAAVQTALETNATVLGLDMTGYSTLIADRRPSVANDIYTNKPAGGYNLTGLQSTFEEIVATRIVCQASLDEVNAATSGSPLKDLDYVNILLKEFQRVQGLYTWHSNVLVSAKITQLQGLLDRYAALPAADQNAVLLTVSSADYTSSTGSLTALDAALTTEETAVATALNAVNGASPDNNYAAVTTALVSNANVLGLNLDSYNTLIAARQPAVANDIYNSKPTGGYTLTQLQTAFNAIVATRIVFQNSMIIVNNASAISPLTNLDYVQMLIDNLNAVNGAYTYHSGIKIADKITQLQGLVDRYGKLSLDRQAAALLTVSSADYGSSTDTLNALDAALKTQEAITAALAVVNNASPANNYAAVTTALVSNAGVLGLNLTDYNTLIADRQPSVANDIFTNKPTGGYNLTQLQNTFKEIVATRIVCQNSLDLVNGATANSPLKDLGYVSMLLAEFKRVQTLYTYHSNVLVSAKVTQLQGLLDRYAALPAADQNAVLLTVSSADYTSSTGSLTALDAALTTEETAVAAALAAVNGASSANNYAAVRTALETNATVLGLNMTDYNKLDPDGRKSSVANDVYTNKPAAPGYNLTGLQSTFKEIVATRIVCQNSLNEVNAAATTPLQNLDYVSMLLTEFTRVQSLYTWHSNVLVTDKITQLQGLVDRYGKLSTDRQAAALALVSAGIPYGSSTLSLNALDAALKTQEAITAALAAVNTASSASNYAAVTTALVSNATVLGLDLTSYNKLIADRQPAVANDIYNSKPAGGYTLSQLQVAFNAIVATRIVCQNSLDLVNGATAGKPLADLTYVQMLLTEFNKVKSAGSYTYHSGMTIDAKIAQLSDLVTRFGNLSTDRQAAALALVSAGVPYGSSTLSLNALDAALTTEEHDTVTITVNSANGSVSPSGAQVVLHNGSLTLTITPAQYYYLYSITRNGVETAQPAVNRNLGQEATVVLTSIDNTTSLTVNIFRRGDIAGHNDGPDGAVDIQDVMALISEWRTSGTGLLADLNCDGKVDIVDVSMMMSLWSQPQG